MFRTPISIRTGTLPRPFRTIGSFQAKTISLPLRPCAFLPIGQMASSSSSNSRARDQGQSFPTFKDRGPSKSPTHFLCLPLHGNYYQTLPPAHLSLKTALKQFTIDEANPESGLSESDEKFRIPPDAFRPFDTLHLTLGVMTLSTKEEVENAISTLKSLDLSQFLPPAVSGGDKKLYVDLKGLQPFLNSKSTIAGCRVLYLPPTDASSSSQTRLLQFSEALRSHLIEKGILTPENKSLKLHATVINTVYCKRINPALDSRNTRNKDKSSRSNKIERVEFDGSEVLERYKDRVWAEVVLEDGTVEVIGGGYESIVDRLIE
ncbi:hypothetical protein TWF173_002612 [Orbilia oligospora]|nr:hypothetical protein TWF173_002612 [Orbilia oligospora]